MRNGAEGVGKMQGETKKKDLQELEKDKAPAIELKSRRPIA